MKKQIDISIAMMTYYHENFVSKAIESVLEQKTKYTYEIVISDDGSKDGTIEILKKYKKKYPGIIKLYFNERNIGISQNNYNTRLHCRGKYIATLSGDDYWDDKYKLQKQIDFLEKNKNYFAVATNVKNVINGTKRTISISPKRKYRNNYISIDSYLRGAIFGTHGLIMRNAYLSKEGRDYFSIMPKLSRNIDDATECILILLKSPIYILDNSFVVHRVYLKSDKVKNMNTLFSTNKKIYESIDLYRKISSIYNLDYSWIFAKLFVVGCIDCIRKKEFYGIKELYIKIPKIYRQNIIFKSIIKMWEALENSFKIRLLSLLYKL